MDNFSWENFVELVKQDESGLFNKAREYASKYVPSYLYKYTSFPQGKQDIDSRIDQLVQGKLWLSKRFILNDPFELFMVSIDNSSKEAREYYNNVMNEKEIACFSTSGTNKLMWAHYANSHKGFCIKFKRSPFSLIFPVEYVSQKVNMSHLYENFYKMKGDLFSKDKKRREEAEKLAFCLEPIFYYKDIVWQYENEMRIVRQQPNNDNAMGHLHSLYDLGLEIDSFICGINASCETKNLLQLLCKKINQAKRKNIMDRLLNSGEIVSEAEVHRFILEKKYCNEKYVSLYSISLCDDLSIKENLLWEER